MRRLLYAIFFLSGLFTAYGQTNQWVNYDQEYYKFSFSESGNYRLTYNDLEGFGDAISNFNHIQLFVRGEEIPKRYVGFEDSQFDNGDFIEFYLKANEGEQDSVWYRPYSARPNVKSNLFSDETFLFVTVGAEEGLVMDDTPFESSANLETDHIAEDIYSYTDEWSFNISIGLLPNLMQSYFERGESWTGKLIMKDSLAQKQIYLKNLTKTSPYPIQFDALINTRSHITHNVEAKIGSRKYGEIRRAGFDHFYLNTTINPSELMSDDSFVFSTQSLVTNTFEAHSWSNLKVSYPQVIDMAGLTDMLIHLPESEWSTSNIKVLNPVANPLIYDISNPYHPTKLNYEIQGDGSILIFINDRNLAKTIFIGSQIKALDPKGMINFKEYDREADYIIITHDGLLSAAEDYKAYRSSEGGGSYQVLIADIAELYDQFNYGEHGPGAIRNFLDFQYQPTGQDKYLLLLGPAVSFPDVMKDWVDRDLVPTVGYPASDNLLSAGLHGTDIDQPLYRTGRVNAENNLQAQVYLNKVIEYENQQPELWNKNILHLNGGSNPSEINRMKSIMIDLEQRASQSQLNTAVEHLVKQSIEPVEDVNISKQVNDGVSLITFMGHATPTHPDFNIGFVSKPSMGFSNKAKYPLMYFNGCGVGNIFYKYETLGSDWLFTPDKGSIAILSNSYFSYISTSEKYLHVLYENIFNEEIGQSIGNVQNATILDIKNSNPNLYDIANYHQLLLQGDPALVIFPADKPDYAIGTGSVQIHNSDLSKTLGEASQIKVSGKINNLGLIQPDEDVEIKAEVSGVAGIDAFKVSRSTGNAFEIELDISEIVKSVKVTIDPAHKLSEWSRDNNVTEIEIDWEQAANYNRYPHLPETDKLNPVLIVFLNEFPVIETKNVFLTQPKVSFELKDENPMDINPENIMVFLKKADETTFSEIESNQLNLYLKDPNTLAGWMLSPPELGVYTLMINGRDLNGNTSGQMVYVSWEIKSDFEELRIVPSPNPGSEWVRFSVFNVNESSTALVEINDMYGRALISESHPLREGTNHFFITQPLTSGIYVYNIKLNGKVYSGKLIVL